MILFHCECGRELQARDEDAGRKSKCPACGLVSVIPPPEAIIPEEAPIADARRTQPYAVQADEPAANREERRRPYRVREDEPPRKRPRKSDRYRDDEGEDRSRRNDESESTSGKATASLVLGLLSFPCAFNIFTGLPAIIVGAMALSEIGQSRGKLGGKGMAVTGIITGGLGIVVMIPLIILGALLFPAVQSVHEARDRVEDTKNLRIMALAMHNFHDANGAFPRAAAFRSRDGKPLLSWRVALLPYIEHQGLYNTFKFDEPWDGPNNIRMLSMMPKWYLQPGQANDGSGMTYYQVFVGPGTVFDDSSLPKKPLRIGGWPEPGIRITDITDGTSNTILIAEGKNAVPWTKPEDLPFNPNGPLPALGGRFTQRYNVALADGSFRVIDRNFSEDMLKAMITRNGGEVVWLP
jgi:hypothetical protein